MHGIRAIQLSIEDHRRFHRHAAHAGQAVSSANEQALMMYFAHSVEKGLSRVDFRPGFGAKPISALARVMNGWTARGMSLEDPYFDVACAVMREYFSRHYQLGVSAGDKEALFSNATLTAIRGSSGGGGVRNVVTPEAAPSTFRELALRRVTTREFAPLPVEKATLDGALSIAARAPSACNRQSSRAHVVRDPDLIDRLLRIQGGLGGYKRPPVLLLITSDTSFYVEATERNQPFVDGSLFAMSLIFALEERGLGTCALTAMMWAKNERAVRDLLHLEESEVFVTFIAVGHRPESFVVPFSRRSPLDEIRTFH